MVGCARSDARAARQFLERGDRYAKQGDLKSAAIEYRNAVRRAPSLVDAHRRLAETSSRLQDHDTLTTELLKLAELQPNDVTAQLRASESCIATGRLGDARTLLERAVALDPGQLEATRALAALYTVNGDGALAERTWKTVASHEKGDPFALADYYIGRRRFADADRELRPLLDVPARAQAARLRLAGVLYERGMKRDAEAMLDAAERAEPRQAAPLLLRARIRSNDRRAADAASAYERAAQIDPQSIEALAGLTMLDLDAKRGADAIARLDRALAKTPDAVPLLMLTARTYVATGAADRAERTLHRVLEVSPKEASAHGLLGQLYLEQHRLDAAREQFQQLESLAADPMPARTMIAMILDAEQRPAEAQARYEEILATSSAGAAAPAAGVAANNLAWMYLSQDRFAEALRYAQVAKQALHRLPQVNDTLGWVYYRTGRIAEAIPLLADAVDTQPRSPLYRYHLGMAYRSRGMTAEARQQLTAALADSASFAERGDAEAALAALDR